MFSFYEYLFVGFYFQMDSEGKVTYLGVLRDVCSEKDWDEIYAEHARKKAEAEAAAAA